MPAARAIWARRWIAPIDVLAGHHHEVGHLVDDHHQIGQGLEIELLLLVDRLAGLAVVAGMHRAGERFALGLGVGEARVVAVDVAHAELRHLAIAVLPSRAPPI